MDRSPGCFFKEIIIIRLAARAYCIHNFFESWNKNRIETIKILKMSSNKIFYLWNLASSDISNQNVMVQVKM